MAKTKKVRSAGRFGPRYGRKIRLAVIKSEEKKKERTCPSCFKKTLKRLSAGVWECKKCRLKFAGKAYKPR